MRWTVVIPAKALPAAKSRLAEASSGAAEHARLAAALRTDTIAAALSASCVARVVLVVDAPSDVPSGVHVLVQNVPGLNPAIEEAATFAARSWPRDGIAAVLGDLPALTAGDLAEALDAAAAIERGFVPDAAGTGTTLLTARPGVELRPSFGRDSAQRHGLIAQVLPAGPGLRRDVDTVDDLREALDLGVGPATLAAATPVVHLSGR